eukprot:Selendium_serpulae@DN5004_c0_g1_i2.p1
MTGGTTPPAPAVNYVFPSHPVPYHAVPYNFVVPTNVPMGYQPLGGPFPKAPVGGGPAAMPIGHASIYETPYNHFLSHQTGFDESMGITQGSIFQSAPHHSSDVHLSNGYPGTSQRSGHDLRDSERNGLSMAAQHGQSSVSSSVQVDQQMVYAPGAFSSQHQQGGPGRHSSGAGSRPQGSAATQVYQQGPSQGLVSQGSQPQSYSGPPGFISQAAKEHRSQMPMGGNSSGQAGGASQVGSAASDPSAPSQNTAAQHHLPAEPAGGAPYTKAWEQQSLSAAQSAANRGQSSQGGQASQSSNSYSPYPPQKGARSSFQNNSAAYHNASAQYQTRGAYDNNRSVYDPQGYSSYQSGGQSAYGTANNPPGLNGYGQGMYGQSVQSHYPPAQGQSYQGYTQMSYRPNWTG